MFQKSFCFSLLLMSSVAMAYDDGHAKLDLTGWEHVDRNDFAVSYMSPKYVSKVGYKKVQAWEIRVHDQDNASTTMLSGEYSKILHTYDCKKRTSTLKQWIDYTQSGAVKLSHVITDDKIKTYQVAPQTIDERMLNYACSQFGW